MKKKCLLFIALFVFIFCNISRAQLIYTFAGNGTAGYAGNGGSPTGAELNTPTGVAIDGAGNIYIADRNNNVIRKVSISGLISTIAGNGIAGFSGDTGIATSAMLSAPTGVAVDGSGNLYIVDQGNSRIRKVTPTDSIYTIAGNGSIGYSGDSGPATAASFNSPIGIMVDDTGNIYVADLNNNVIRKIDTSGNIQTFAGTGVAGYSGDLTAATAAQLNHPTSITVDALHNFYIADDSNNVVRKINTSGIISTFAGTGTAGFSGDSGPAISAQLSGPYGVTIDGSGNIYITDQNNNRLRKVNTSGNIFTIAGTGTAGYTGDGGSASTATLNSPAGLVVDANGNKYIADIANNVVRVVSSDIAPSFVKGPSQTLVLCEQATQNMDTMLEISDADFGQTETWTIISGPEHGIVGSIPYTASSNGGTIVPTGITYTPNAGYSGTDVLTFQVSDGIAVAVTTIGVTINPTPNVIVPSDQVLCNGAATIAAVFSSSVTGTTYAWTNNTSSIGLGASGTGNIASFGAMNTSSVVVTATVTVTPSANGCIGNPDSFMITVYPTPDVTVPASQVVCNNAATTAVNFTGDVSGTTYTWTNNDGSIGLASTGTGGIPSFIATNTSSVAVTATVTVTPSANGCTGIPKSFSIRVNPTPDVATQPDRILCNGATSAIINFSSNVSGTTYTWINNNSSIGLATSGAGSLPSFTAANASSVAVTATVTVTPVANGCAGNSQSFSITVNPTPNVSAISNQTLCNGATSAAVNFSSNVSGATYTWTNSNSSIGLASSGTGNVPSFAAANVSSVIVTATVTVTPSANGCPGTPQRFDIIVNPTPVVTNLSDIALCNGAAGTVANFNSNVSGASYTWTNNNSSIGLGTSGVGSIPSFTATNTSSVTMTATVTVTPSANGCPGIPQSFSITVNPTPDVSAVSNQTLCSGSSSTAVNFSSDVSGATYRWTNSNSSIGLATSGTGSVPSFTAANTSSVAVTATVTVTPSANGCGGIPQSFDIIVNPKPVVTNLSDIALCNGATGAVANFNSNVSGASYTWTNSNSSIGLVTSGAGNVPSFTATNTSSVAATATVTVTAAANGCTGSPQSFSITVNPTPDIAAISNQTVCNGTASTAVNFSGNVSGTTYTWTNNNSSIGLSPNGTGSVPSFIVENTSSVAVTATVTVTPAANGCIGNSQSFDITVNPTPVVTNLSDIALCNGATGAIANFSSNVSGTSYTWTNNNSSIGLATSGAGSISSFTATNTSSVTMTATVTVTPSANGCPGIPQSFNITVSPTPDVVAPSNQMVCNGVASTAVNFSSAISGTTYTWANNDGSIGLASSGTGNIPSFTATNTSSVAVTATITVTPAINSCIGTSQSFNITVNPTPDVVTPVNQTVCNGAVSTAVSFSGNVSGTTYTWTNSNSSIGLASSGATSVPSFIATNTSNVAITAMVTVTPSANGCVGISQSFNITVNPTPAIITPSNQALCNGIASAAVNFSSNVSGTTYTWTNNNSSIGLATSGVGNIPSFIATNSTSSPIIATINVIPSGSGCTGLPVGFMVTVNPNPVLSSPLIMPSICDSIMFIYMPGSATAGTTFTWSRNAVTGISNPAASGIDSIDEVLVNTTTDTVTVTYMDTLNANGCMNIQNITVVVNPKPILSDTVNAFAICSNTTFNFIPTSATPGTTFAWSRANIPGISNSAASGADTIDEVLINTTTNPIAVTYTDTLMAYGCPNTENISVVVNPLPVLSNTLTSPSVCDSNLFTYVPASATSGTTFSWSRATVAGISNPAASDTGSINEILIDTTVNQVTVTYVDTIMANGCVNTEDIVVTVNPRPMLTSVTTPSAICNNTVFSYTSSSATAGTTFAWSRASVAGISNPAASGAGVINETLTNSMNTPVIVVYVDTLMANGCSNTQNISVTVNPTLTLSSTLTPTSICSNTLFSYTPSSAVTGATFSWTRPYVPGISLLAGSGAGNISETLVNTTNVNVDVTYIYSVSAYGCSDSQDVVVAVYPTPVLSSAHTDSVCSGAVFNYTPNSPITGTTFTWARAMINGITPDTASGMGNISETLTNSFSTPVDVSYMYTLMANGCSATDSILVVVNTSTPAPVIATSTPSSVCDNTLYQNFGATTPAPTGVDYVWSVTNAMISTVGSTKQYALINFETPGTAVITLTAMSTAFGCQSQAMATVNVSSSMADAPADVIYFTHEFICLQNNETGYQWGYDDASTFSPTELNGEINQNYFNDTPNFSAYNYWVLVSNNGCQQKAYYNQPNGAAHKPSATVVNVYPNPASDKVIVDITTNQPGAVQVEILDMLGQKINSTETLNNRAEINVADIPSGTYLVNCYRNGARISSAGFVKN